MALGFRSTGPRADADPEGETPPIFGGFGPGGVQCPRMNEGHEFRERIGADAAGARLLDHMADRHRHSDRDAWRARIDAGQVTVDGRPAPPDERLRDGAIVRWRRPPWREPEAPTGLVVLHRDADVLAVAKPAGLPTLPGAGFLRRTVAAGVAELVPGAAPAHRLGRHTSGIVLCGTSRAGRRGLAAAFAARRVRKVYRALADGAPSRDAFVVEQPIGPVPHAALGTVHAATPAGRSARSDVRVVERRADAFLCDVEIRTGRPHQIRIHLAAAGHPLVGDPLYASGGLPEPGTRAVPGDGGYALHAALVELPHPVTGARLTVACPPPPALCLPGERME